LRHPVPPAETSIPKIAANAACPPYISISCRAGHDESYLEADIFERYDKEVETRSDPYWDEDRQRRVIDVLHETIHVDQHVRYVKSPMMRVDQGGGQFAKGEPKLHKNEYVNFTRTYTEYKRTWDFSEHFEYRSWEGRTQIPEFPDVVAVTIEPVLDVQIPKAVRTAIEVKKAEIRRVGESKDTDIQMSEEINASDWTRERVTFPLMEDEIDRIKKHHAKCTGKCAWIMLWLVGFQTCYEAFSSLGEDIESGKGTTVKVKYVKVVSMDGSKRCGRKNPDWMGRIQVERELEARRIGAPTA
jgi:hypothetical protein